MAIATSARADVEINATNFPDDNFRNYVKRFCQFDENNYLTDNEIKAVKDINAPNRRISNLKGIEYFTSLTVLKCRSNELTALDVSKNTALKELDCSYNMLTSLDISNNTELTVLYCYGNKLTSLDVSKHTKLLYLGCGGNLLTSLDVSKNTAMKELECYNNQLTSLDVSNNSALMQLFCENNELASLNLSNNTRLTYLRCSTNQLKKLNLLKNTELTVLYCSYNQLTSLSLLKNTELTELDCSHNQLTALDVSKNTKMKELTCADNQIKGAAMDALIASLPARETNDGVFRAIATKISSEQNVVTTDQVAAAKVKGWTTYNNWKDYKWEEYAGGEPVATDIPTVNFNAGTASQFYSLDGQRVSGRPTKKGVYVRDGKKVVVK